MLHALINNNLSGIATLCKKHKVASLSAFGSVCSDHFSENSDVDFLVTYFTDQIPQEDYADNYFDLMDGLEQLLGKKVDLVTEKTLENPYFIQSVQMTKTPVYVA
ncbi:MAG TPA: nucleotidyltransferase domain-containing protein [Bacteroidia bacterium]|jgi:predicted nucleotidyltransferase|nr:nucleotidyltransferase domain-containing protein [Bacteroidia bacterium]